ncbi:MAG TPA: DUF6569 family protein [Planctomycetaceae bacterium]|jgi:hypothetical protein|nr:DUF6569 family protein [Planctomycetaceae bacterium]
MRSPMLSVLTGFLFAVSCIDCVAQSERTLHTSPQSIDEIGYRVGEPIRHKNLAIFPVLSKTEQNADRYITLDEGLRAHSVEVVEVGANRNVWLPAFVTESAVFVEAARAQSAMTRRNAQVGRSNAQAVPANADKAQRRAALQATLAYFQTNENSGANEVNRLMVVNRSSKPLYLMPGEVVVGGDQDRTIGEETIIEANGKPVSIDVFCVEHGRWGGRQVAQSAPLLRALGGAATPAEIESSARRAKAGDFVATTGPLGKAGRVAVQSAKSQQAVWDNVAKTNAALKVDSESGAFTEAYAAKPVRDDLEPFVAALSAKVGSTSRVVGAVVAINGKIESVDVFESTPLFRKLWPKLLKSYALDAVSADAAKPASKNNQVGQDKSVFKEASVADASAFLSKILQGAVSETKQTKSGLVVQHREAKDVTSYSAGGMGGGMGGAPIHAAGYSR